jgi:hypothetical protein
MNFILKAIGAAVFSGVCGLGAAFILIVAGGSDFACGVIAGIVYTLMNLYFYKKLIDNE